VSDGDKTRGQARRLSKGGFAQGDIPPGFERSREPHRDAPLSARGRFIFNIVLAFVTLGGVALIWFVATR
jgi:hypothetical protein